jgi:hypothetical protein
VLVESALWLWASAVAEVPIRCRDRFSARRISCSATNRTDHAGLPLATNQQVKGCVQFWAPGTAEFRHLQATVRKTVPDDHQKE